MSSMTTLKRRAGFRMCIRRNQTTNEHVNIGSHRTLHDNKYEKTQPINERAHRTGRGALIAAQHGLLLPAHLHAHTARTQARTQAKHTQARTQRDRGKDRQMEVMKERRSSRESREKNRHLSHQSILDCKNGHKTAYSQHVVNTSR